ncbi:MAG: permease prefix domain 1-containing protein [Thermoanaerobaculia bacterium]
MFDVDHEVTAWSAAVHAERCRPEAGAAELSDHLHCEIDRARAEGLSDEEAFRIATSRLGSQREISRELDKNRTLLGSICRVAAKLDGAMTNPHHRRLLMAHALIWAAVMIASELLFAKTGSRQISAWFLTGVLIPLWLASEQLLRRALRHRPAA